MDIPDPDTPPRPSAPPRLKSSEYSTTDSAISVVAVAARGEGGCSREAPDTAWAVLGCWGGAGCCCCWVGGGWGSLVCTPLSVGA